MSKKYNLQLEQQHYRPWMTSSSQKDRNIQLCGAKYLQRDENRKEDYIYDNAAISVSNSSLDNGYHYRERNSYDAAFGTAKSPGASAKNGFTNPAFTDDTKEKKEKKVYFTKNWIIASVVVVILVLIAYGCAVFFGYYGYKLFSPPTSSTTTPGTFDAGHLSYLGSAKINGSYNDDLENTSSSFHQTLSKNVESAVDFAINSVPPLSNVYNESTVLGFSRGSIFVHFRLVFNKPVSIYQVKEALDYLRLQNFTTFESGVDLSVEIITTSSVQSTTIVSTTTSKSTSAPTTELPTTTGCPAGRIRCESSECIREEWKCDREYDCADKSDEKDCSNCTSEQFTCFDYTCIPKEKRCSGTYECSDRSDEANCAKSEASTGMIEIMVNEVFLPICSHEWDSSYNNDVCSLLGYGGFVESGVYKMTTSAYAIIKTPLKDGTLIGSFVANSACVNSEVLTLKCKAKECGMPVKNINLVPYILSGTNAVQGHWPWQVALYEDGAFICGGSVLTNDIILTATHCFSSDFATRKYEVVLGTTNIAQGSTPTPIRISASAIKINDKFDENHFGHDIAVIKLATPVNFTDNIRPVCLPTSSEVFTSQSLCYTTGWGNINGNDKGTEQLKQAKMKLVPSDKCNTLHQGSLLDTEICAGYVGSSISVCNGDSGGPLVCLNQHKRWVLVGITSYYVGSACDTHGIPNGFADIKKLMPWIQKTLAAEDLCTGHHAESSYCTSVTNPNTTVLPPPVTTSK